MGEANTLTAAESLPKLHTPLAVRQGAFWQPKRAINASRVARYHVSLALPFTWVFMRASIVISSTKRRYELSEISNVFMNASTPS